MCERERESEKTMWKIFFGIFLYIAGCGLIVVDGQKGAFYMKGNPEVHIVIIFFFFLTFILNTFVVAVVLEGK